MIGFSLMTNVICANKGGEEVGDPIFEAEGESYTLYCLTKF